VDVAHRLLRNNIPFHWLYPYHVSYCIEQPPKQDEWNTGLEWRPHGWQASPEEYTAYERHRDTYITWNSYCVSAMVRDGLLWRLLVDTLGYDNTNLGQLDILGGRCGYDHEVVVNGMQLVEAVVSPHDEDVLCGVYKVSSTLTSNTQHGVV
jgi:hypothetical protein